MLQKLITCGLIIASVLSTIQLFNLSNRISHWEVAMCIISADLVDFESLSAAQKKTLLRDLRKRKDALQAQLKGVNDSLKCVDQALKVVEKKAKR
jgi:hypothetical protein